MHAVNLLPKVAVQQKPRQPTNLVLACAAAVPVLACSFVAVGYRSAHSNVAAARDSLAALQAAAARYTLASDQAGAAATATAEAEWSTVIGERKAREATLDSILAHRVKWDVVMGDVARVVPKGVWLNQLSVATPAPFIAAATTGASTTSTNSASSPGALTIAGYSESELSIALLLEHLQLLPGISQVVLGTTASTTVGKKDVVQFSVTTQIAPPKAFADMTAAAAAAAPTTTTTTTTTQ
jgi:Tfp pilus assembly protein PilN